MIFNKLIAISLALLLLSASCITQQENTVNNNINNIPNKPNEPKIVIMKGVGIHIPQEDFINMKKAGIDILTTEWGMEEDIKKVEMFLDNANDAGLKVVLDGGFSHTAWGFTDDDFDNLPKGKLPTWQKDRVQNWIKTFKDHPAVFGWDICNEYGENLPSGVDAKNSQWPETAITLSQLKQARNDVLQIDPDKPILIRTYEWESDEPPFGNHRPFEAGIAEIVMLNFYSNYLEHNKLQWPDVIEDVGSGCAKAIKEKDPHVKIWISVAAFEDKPSFQRPTVTSLTRDIREALKISNVDGIGFFEWGPPIDDKHGWHLPETGPDLWEVIKQNIPTIKAK